ncbi:MAG: fimbrillin family protein [Rikenellaceae bacterium]
MNRYILSILSAVTLLFGCSKSDNSGEIDQEELQIVISPIIHSRATELAFEKGDQIGLSMVMESDNSLYVENVDMSYNGSIFEGDHKWYSSSSETSTLAAYYPYISSETLPTSFTIKEDQSTMEGYTASDLLIATKSEVVPTSSAILMAFTHALSRVVVEIDNQSGVSVESVIIGGSRPTVTFDAFANSVEVDLSASVVDIVAPLWDDQTYKVVVVPQSVALTFYVTLSDGRVLSREKESVTLSQGGEYLAQITIVEDDIDISLSGDINEWSDQGTIPSWGEGDNADDFEEYEDYIIYEGESYKTATYNGFTVMIDNLRYIPNGKVVSSDPSDANGVWYPYSLSLDPSDLEAEGYIAEPLTDEASIIKYGYLYDFATAFGEDVVADNYDSFVATQGICPKGWYIPTMEDWYALTGDGYQQATNPSAPFYDSNVGYSSIQRANELGFNHVYPGAIANDKYNTMVVESEYTQSSYVGGDAQQESVVGKNSLSYYMSSTPVVYYPNSDLACYYALYTSHASKYLEKGSISVMLTYEHYGISVRCAKVRQ